VVLVLAPLLRRAPFFLRTASLPADLGNAFSPQRSQRAQRRSLLRHSERRDESVFGGGGSRFLTGFRRFGMTSI